MIVSMKENRTVSNEERGNALMRKTNAVLKMKEKRIIINEG